MSRSRIYVVAGPRACGKSTFIERCKTDGAAFLPDELAGLAQADGPYYFMSLDELSRASASELLVHVDLVTPFVEWMMPDGQELVSRMGPEAFSQYPGASLLSECRELSVLTLQVPRVTSLRRWLSRSAEQQNPSVRTVIAQLYSDAYGEDGYGALYAAWERYAAGLPHSTSWTVVETRDGVGYSIAPA